MRRVSLRGCMRALTYIAIGLIVVLVLLLGGWTAVTNRQITQTEVAAIATDAPGRFVTVEGHEMHVLVRGELGAERPLLLLHGFGAAGAVNWDQLTPHLAPEPTLIMPDMLGFGYSERLTEPSTAYTHTGRARHFNLLLDELEIESVDIVAASYGGGVAVQFALDYPERVERLVLIGPQIYTLGGGFFEALGALPLGVGRAMTWTALGSGPVAEMMIRGGCESDAFCPSEAELAARLRPTHIAGTSDALRAMTLTRIDGRIPQDTAQLDHPTLIIWGENDDIFPVSEGERLVAEVENGRLHIIPNGGHSPYNEAPETVANLIQQFLTP